MYKEVQVGIGDEILLVLYNDGCFSLLTPCSCGVSKLSEDIQMVQSKVVVHGILASLLQEMPSSPTRGKPKSSVNNSSKKRAKSLANTIYPEVGMTMTSHMNGATAAAVDLVLERHGLNNRKRRDNCWTTGPLSSLASHLEEEKRNSSHLLNSIEGDHAVVGDRGVHHSTSFATSGSLLDSEELEVSFSINLFPNGFTIGKANEELFAILNNFVSI